MTDTVVYPAETGGLDVTGIDSQTRPQDDFFQWFNGAWLERFDIPADKAIYGAFTALSDDAERQVHAIITELAESDAADSHEAKLIATLYASFMDTDALNKRGIAALDPILAEIDALESVAELPELFGRWGRLGIRTPVGAFIHQDNKDSSRYLLDIRQSGLGLPDRDFYLEDTFEAQRSAYADYIAQLWTLAGWAAGDDAKTAADAIVELETKLAKVSWDKVRNRDPEATYNLVAVEDFTQQVPPLQLTTWLAAGKVPDSVTEINVGQPDYFDALGELINEVPLSVWQQYLRQCALSGFAPMLSSDLDEANFAFYGTVLSGVPEQRERWKRAVSLIEGGLGEVLGKLYVERHFPPENKQRMVQLVDNLIAAYADAIDDLDWMTDETKHKAQEKLATFRPKIGYPDRWRDYSALELPQGDLIAAELAISAFVHDREVAKLGGPIDRDEWLMPPQMVNAYYNPEANEIVFPAAILQPPFFNMDADDAVNYGAIGAVIGHEISHGFDDKGSQYDGEGNLRNWWTDSDQQAFSERTAALSSQYASYEPVEGHHINGDLTLGENIADVSGLAVALRAWRRSLDGKPAPVIGDLSGEQRFFCGWAQVWRAKARQEEEIRRLAIDPHSPPKQRVVGVLVNNDDFVDAFSVTKTDQMWRDPKDRVHIW